MLRHRISLIVCVSLLTHGTAGKPYMAWGKVADAAIQDIMKYDGDEGKLLWGLKEVEPPEEMDVISYDVDPSMAIWKSWKVKDQQGQYLKAEEDMDELYHPSMIRTLDTLPRDNTFHLAESQPALVHFVTDPQSDQRAEVKPEVGDWVKVQTAPEEDQGGHYHAEHSRAVQVDRSPYEPVVSGEPQARVHLEPEPDRDELYHADRSPFEPVVSGEPQARVHLEPEPDRGELYHADRSPFEPVVSGEPQVRVHLKPEPDRDDRYHRDRVLARRHGVVNIPVPVQVRFKPLDGWSQTKHQQAEEDRDHLHH